ncbi:MAG: HlyC/CorC family transporter [Clostridiales bacterium]|nr:HlyC/CorC family transporter [Clostridiales bacterium]
MIGEITVLVILIMVNAFFAATEIAFISINDAKISKQANEGNKKAKQIKNMLKNPSKFLATIQIGITLAGFLSSAFASEAFATRLAPVLDKVFPLGISFWNSVSIVIVTLILSYFSLVFGELVPKRVAMKYSSKIANFAVGFIGILSIVTAPFVKFLTFSTNIISKLFGVSENDEEVVTEEDIRDLVDVSEEKGVIEEEEKEMINNVFEFNDKVVSEVMKHRTEVFAMDINSNVKNIIKMLDKNKYSRVPIYEDSIDNIKGVLYVKDLFKYVHSNKEINIKDTLRKAYFVSENKPINEVFRELQINKIQLAVVVDEYGGTAGIITMEDIIEELVGNIFDEYDEEEIEYEVIDENTYMINGNMTIYDFEKIVKIEIPEGDYDTISGYLIEQLGRIPNEKEKPLIETDNASYKIEKYKDQRIMLVKVCKVM